VGQFLFQHSSLRRNQGQVLDQVFALGVQALMLGALTGELVLDHLAATGQFPFQKLLVFGLPKGAQFRKLLLGGLQFILQG
jgi:hypothetical protein